MKVLIYPDRQHAGWMRADGRGLLIPTKGIPSVTSTATGIGFREEVREQVADALRAAGYTVADSTAPRHPRRVTHTWTHVHYVSDEDWATILPDDTPGGHWQDEQAQCPKCNPDYVRGKFPPEQITAADARVRVAAEIDRQRSHQ